MRTIPLTLPSKITRLATLCLALALPPTPN